MALTTLVFSVRTNLGTSYCESTFCLPVSNREGSFYGSGFIKKNQNNEKFRNGFIKNDIIYVNLPFIYENPIILDLLKIVTIKFTIYILTILISTFFYKKTIFLP